MLDVLRAAHLICFLLVQGLLAGGAKAQDDTPVPPDLGNGCAPVISLDDPTAMAELINAVGLAEFRNPPEIRPVSEAARLDLIVDYAAVNVAGCSAYLRTYNGKIIGPTIRARPGETLYIRLINRLDDVNHPHPRPEKCL